eukprot:3662456-Rhodomonas_salina.1
MQGAAVQFATSATADTAKLDSELLPVRPPALSRHRDRHDSAFSTTCLALAAALCVPDSTRSSVSAVGHSGYCTSLCGRMPSARETWPHDTR